MPPVPSCSVPVASWPPRTSTAATWASPTVTVAGSATACAPPSKGCRDPGRSWCSPVPSSPEHLSRCGGYNPYNWLPHGPRLGISPSPLEIKPDFPTAAAIKRDREASRDRVIRERLARKLRIRELLGDAQEYPFPVWIWKAGDTLFVGTPGEAYSDLQQALRAAFPDLAVVVMNIVNGSIGYLPPDKLYDRDLYEVWQTPFQRGSYERLLEGCLDTIKGLILR